MWRSHLHNSVGALLHTSTSPPRPDTFLLLLIIYYIRATCARRTLTAFSHVYCGENQKTIGGGGGEGRGKAEKRARERESMHGRAE
mmetsp:Transcript_5304/g.11912  ORF Transcript_5304/g.11912 Transcript_5304/m.11912 type:complete len:86 (-) Transcript_5304:922-1179(-)